MIKLLNKKSLRFLIFAVTCTVVAISLFSIGKSTISKKQPRYQYLNCIRRVVYEFYEEAALMAKEAAEFFRSNYGSDYMYSRDIVIYYGANVKDREKVDYWRNVDEIRFRVPAYASKYVIRSNSYHPYCGDSMNCSLCSGAEWVEASIFGIRDPEPDEKMKQLSRDYEISKQDFYDNVEKKYIKAIAHWTPTWSHCDVWLFLRNKEESLKWAHRQVEVAPCASSYWSRGEAWEMNGDFSKALEDYQTAWEYDPAYIYQVAKARVYMKQKQPEKAAHAYCIAIRDIDHRCDTSIMNYQRAFKYDLVKSRLLTCPPYLEPSGIQTLRDISTLLDKQREKLREKDWLAAKAILFWTMELEKQGKLHDQLVTMPLCGFPPLQPYHSADDCSVPPKKDE